MHILQDCAKSFEHKFEFREFAFGGAAIDRFGTPLPADTLAGCKAADAILLGAVGGPPWDALPLAKRPEAGLLGLRQALGLFINLRPIRLRPALRGISPLRRERINDCDFEIVRELAGDIYFGAHETAGQGSNARARDVAEYTAAEIERDRPLRIRTRRITQPPGHQRGQGQRAGDIRACGGRLSSAWPANIQT